VAVAAPLIDDAAVDQAGLVDVHALGVGAVLGRDLVDPAADVAEPVLLVLLAVAVPLLDEGPRQRAAAVTSTHRPECTAWST
jgi:hypothetical protein